MGNNSLLVILGATGDLVIKKIFPSLESVKDITIITYTRKEMISSKYYSVIGDFDDISPLLNYISKNSFDKIYFYFALPPSLYLPLIKLFNDSLQNKKVKIALEKPFGNSLEEAQRLTEVIRKYGEDNFYLVDHYAAKEQIINLKTNRKDLIVGDIKDVSIEILETDNLEKRGSYFDKVGLIRDVFQSHMLLIARIILNKQIDENNFIVDKNSVKTAQFDSYKKIIGVDPNSKTETLFKANFKCDDTLFNFFSAKGQAKNEKKITINFLDGKSLVIDIDMISSNTISPHEIIIRDFISDHKDFSVTIDDSVAQWRITEEIINLI